MTERSTSNIFAVSLLAGMSGMLLALLVAPRSGRETRRKLELAAGDLRDKTSEGLDHAKTVKSRLSGALKRRGQDNSNTNNNSSAFSESPILTSWDKETY